MNDFPTCYSYSPSLPISDEDSSLSPGLIPKTPCMNVEQEAIIRSQNRLNMNNPQAAEHATPQNQNQNHLDIDFTPSEMIGL